MSAQQKVSGKTKCALNDTEQKTWQVIIAGANSKS